MRCRAALFSQFVTSGPLESGLNADKSPIIWARCTSQSRAPRPALAFCFAWLPAKYPGAGQQLAHQYESVQWRSRRAEKALSFQSKSPHTLAKLPPGCESILTVARLLQKSCLTLGPTKPTPSCISSNVVQTSNHSPAGQRQWQEDPPGHLFTSLLKMFRSGPHDSTAPHTRANESGSAAVGSLVCFRFHAA